MTSAMLKKLLCLAVVCMAVITLINPHAAEAAVTTCGMVSKSLGPCMAYLKGTGAGGPPRNCCDGVRALKAAAQTTADRRMACNCMKTAASKTKGLKYNLASRLASQCGVQASYSFNPKVNCNSVQ